DREGSAHSGGTSGDQSVRSLLARGKRRASRGKANRRGEAGRCLAGTHAWISHEELNTRISQPGPGQEPWSTMKLKEICSLARLSFRAGKGSCGAKVRCCPWAAGPWTF